MPCTPLNLDESAASLRSTKDLSAVVAIFPAAGEGGYDVLCDFWLPQDTLPDRVKRHGLFEAWARQGHLTLTEGNTIDQDVIERRIRELHVVES